MGCGALLVFLLVICGACREKDATEQGWRDLYIPHSFKGTTSLLLWKSISLFCMWSLASFTNELGTSV